MKKSSFLMFLSFITIFSIMGCRGEVSYLSKRYIAKDKFLGEKKVGLISLFSELDLKKKILKHAQKKINKRLERQIKLNSPHWSLQKINNDKIIKGIQDKIGYENFGQKLVITNIAITKKIHAVLQKIPCHIKKELSPSKIFYLSSTHC